MATGEQGGRTGHRMRVLAAWWTAAALAAFLVLALVVGIPSQPEGPLLPEATQVRLQIALLGIVVAGALLAWRLPALGGAVMVVAGAALGVLAAFQYRPAVAFLTFLAFLVPGVLLMLAAWWHGRWRPALAGLAAGVVLLLAAGGAAAWQAYDYVFGPTHPSSSTPAPPPGPVRWVWSGAVTPASARVTARLHDPARVRLVVATDAALSRGVQRLTPTGTGDGGRSAAFRVTGLAAATRYHYAVEVDGGLDRLRGTFRTFPRGPASFTIAVSACARSRSNGAVFDAIRRMAPDLYVTSGDFFYGNIERNDAGAFRDEYDGSLGQPAQNALARAVPQAYMWDDHDYGPNDGDASSPSRQAALSAYRELVPHYPLPLDRGTGPIAQAFTIGRVRVLVTDTRSQKVPSGQPGATMLGAAQQAWLIREVRAARGRFPLVVWVNPDPWIAPARAGADDWAGFPVERRRIADAIAGSGVRVVMLAGDAHMVAIDDGSHSDYSRAGGAAMPVMQAAALDRHGNVKGGPYSEGAVPGSGQFGTIRVRDDGGTRIEVVLSGWNWRGDRIMSLRTVVPVPAR